jgi:kinesin family protein 6/9
MPDDTKDDEPKQKQEGITVYLRMRPTKQPSKYYDVGANEGKGQSLKWDIPADQITKDGIHINNTKSKWAFKFDQVLPMDIGQAQVFERVGKNVVQNALDGYNSTVFAYGQTGSGKTFTITGGTEKYEDRGIIPRALSMIFASFRSQPNVRWSAHVSYMEIYNEQGFDLLNESAGSSAKDLPRVKMMEDEHGP